MKHFSIIFKTLSALALAKGVAQPTPEPVPTSNIEALELLRGPLPAVIPTSNLTPMATPTPQPEKEGWFLFKRKKSESAVFEVWTKSEICKNKKCMPKLIRIKRGDKTLLQAMLPADSDEDAQRGFDNTPGRAFSEIRKIHVEDIDGDFKKEFLLDVCAPGTPCALSTFVFTEIPGKEEFGGFEKFWSFGHYELVHYDSDMIPEFKVWDGHFRGMFAEMSYPNLPIEVWQFRNREFKNVTGGFKKILREHAERFRERKRSGDRFVYLVDMCRAGGGKEAWDRLYNQLWRFYRIPQLPNDKELLDMQDALKENEVKCEVYKEVPVPAVTPTRSSILATTPAPATAPSPGRLP